MSNNKLLATFTSPDQIDDTLEIIQKEYNILYGKIFVLESNDSEELICTYNIEGGNMGDGILPKTILVHRKKEYNTLYTINSLNTLIKFLNEGKLDTSFIVPWQNYKNSILLTTGEELRILQTKINKIFYLEN